MLARAINGVLCPQNCPTRIEEDGRGWALQSASYYYSYIELAAILDLPLC